MSFLMLEERSRPKASFDIPSSALSIPGAFSDGFVMLLFLSFGYRSHYGLTVSVMVTLNSRTFLLPGPVAKSDSKRSRIQLRPSALTSIVGA
jgi:hypothetical protein